MTNRTKYIGLALLIVLDQASKLFAIKYFSFLVVYNPSGAFSFKPGGLSYALISALALVAFIALIRSTYRTLIRSWGFILIVAGGISNILDRFISGGVVDFFHSSFWPTFNLADSFITIGSIWLILELIKKPEQVKN